MLLGTLDASLLGNLLTGKGVYRAGKGKGAIAMSQGWGINRAGSIIQQNGFLIPPHPLLILKYTNIIKMNQDLMVFILEIISLK